MPSTARDFASMAPNRAIDVALPVNSCAGRTRERAVDSVSMACRHRTASIPGRPLRGRVHGTLAHLVVVVLLTALTACGGSSSDDSPAPPAVPEPTGLGRLEAAERLENVAVASINEALRAAAARAPPVTPLYDVANYRLSYLTLDGEGREIVASGLISVPLKMAGAKSPLLSLQHGTIYRDEEAPSNHATADEPAVILASLGFIVVAPDYVGYGASKGAPHPYLRAAPSASAVIDLLTAARTWRRREGVVGNGQLFMAGYSEGGYVTVAAHRALQASASTHLAELVAVVPGGGPYHVGVTLDELLSRLRDDNPVLGALISPGLLRRLGSAVRREVRDELLKRLLPEDSDVVFDTRVLDHYLADDEAAIERDSNVHDWAPAAPLRLFHGPDDQTVPYPAAARTLQAMRSRGAGDVSLTDCSAEPSGHRDCVPPYLAFLLGELAARTRDL